MGGFSRPRLKWHLAHWKLASASFLSTSSLRIFFGFALMWHDEPPPPLQFEVNGRTVDIQAYTRFLRQLEASPWIADVTPVSAQTVVEKERPVTAFTIRATYRQADSAYIRTVPLSQSVR